MIQLSKRLTAIADKVEPGSRLADIGSDHGLLPVYLAQSGRIASAIAGELNQGPFEAACRQVAAAGLGAVVSVRKGDGFQVLNPGEADVVTIAGMGGALMADILEQGRQSGKLQGVSRLVLQPNVGEELVRRWLRMFGWVLLGEEILKEDGKIYEVLWAVRAEREEELGEREKRMFAPAELEGFGTIDTEDWLRFGPYLLREASPVFMEKWAGEASKLERVAHSLSKSELEESRQKREAVQEEINRLKELVGCLQKGTPSFKS